MDSMPPNKKVIRDHIWRAATRDGFTGEVFCGLMDNSLKRHTEEKLDFIYLDHSYFKRGWVKQNFRACRNWVHQTSIVKRPDDRLKRFDVQILPWRKTGNKVCVIPNTEAQKQALGGQGWVEATVKRLKEVTDRPVEVRGKDHGEPFIQYLHDVWAVVTWGSVAGVEAALYGIPVFAEPTCPAHPVSAGPIEKIDTPEYAENRHEWACSLAYASWHWKEVGRVEWKDYHYSMKGAT